MAAFQESGGVPRGITYDNLSFVVKRMLTASRQEEQRELIAYGQPERYWIAITACPSFDTGLSRMEVWLGGRA